MRSFLICTLTIAMEEVEEDVTVLEAGTDDSANP
jgi:hypothetical protein